MAIRALRVALVAAETAPFAKTGGLADVMASLGRALHRQGHEVRLFLPFYDSIGNSVVGAGGPGVVAFDPEPVPGLQGIEIGYPGRVVDVDVFMTPLPNSEREDGTPLDVELLDCPELYHRGALFTNDPDEPIRWATLCLATLEALARSEWTPDIIHCNDWHTGLLPLQLRQVYGSEPSLASTRTLLSIHNLSFQGVFDGDVIDQLGLSAVRELFHQDHLNDGWVSLLETGLLYADWLSTVSETYATEIQDPEHGMGLDQLLRNRSDRLIGIVNGIEEDEWSPERDSLIPQRFSVDDLSGKAACREALLARFNIGSESGNAVASEGTGSNDTAPVIGIVSRLTAQKGFDLLSVLGDVADGPIPGDLLPTLLRRKRIRLVVLGSGEQRYERYFQSLRDSFPDRVGVYFGFDEELAHLIEAGSDIFLMPSQYEPCGLNQLYSMSYGTVPVVRRTGGLADTVQPWDPNAGTGTGFVFDAFRPEALADSVDDALTAWADRAGWAVLVRNGMTRDFSWRRRSGQYVDLYRRMLEA